MSLHAEHKCTCDGNCGEKCSCRGKSHSHSREISLADLNVGDVATIVKIKPQLRSKKKFADVGLIVGTELQMEAHAPFGGLLRVKVMGTSLALHSEDAAHMMLQKKD